MVVFLFIVGLVIFLISNLNQKMFAGLQENFNTSYGNTESYTVLSDIKTKDSSVWDYAFLGIFMGTLIVIGLSAYAIRISPVFFWIYGLMSLFVLVLGVILSNAWQDFVAETSFTETIAMFPITNAILGSYYPLIVTAILIIMMGLLFGKPPKEGEI